MPFDINEMIRLFESDPEAAERYRRQAIDDLINNASSSKERLRDLQKVLDLERTVYGDSSEVVASISQRVGIKSRILDKMCAERDKMLRDFSNMFRSIFGGK